MPHRRGPFRSTDPEHGTESDVPVDRRTAYSREKREPSGTYVGRISPDDAGDVEESGAEARARSERER